MQLDFPNDILATADVSLQCLSIVWIMRKASSHPIYLYEIVVCFSVQNYVMSATNADFWPSPTGNQVDELRDMGMAAAAARSLCIRKEILSAKHSWMSSGKSFITNNKMAKQNGWAIELFCHEVDNDTFVCCHKCTTFNIHTHQIWGWGLLCMWHNVVFNGGESGSAPTTYSQSERKIERKSVRQTKVSPAQLRSKCTHAQHLALGVVLYCSFLWNVCHRCAPENLSIYPSISLYLSWHQWRQFCENF